MFCFSSPSKKKKEADSLSDEFRQKISELNLLVERGDLGRERLLYLRDRLIHLRRVIQGKIETETEKVRRSATA